MLLDTGLAGLDGWQVARRVLEHPAEKRPFVLAVGDRDSEEARRLADAAGIDLHLARPVDPDCLRWLLFRFRQVIEVPMQPA
jgi:DNA-binding response OmpR family regulator